MSEDSKVGDLSASSFRDDSGAEASRRLSLGQLFNKGLVSGARGMWEQKIGDKTKGTRKLAPVSQSQDRGLLFAVKLTEAEGGPHAEGAHLVRSSLQEPDLPSHSPARDSPTKGKSPQSALKKMFAKMTGRASLTKASPPPLSRDGSASPGGALSLDSKLSSKKLSESGAVEVVAVTSLEVAEPSASIRSALASIAERAAGSSAGDHQEYEWDEADIQPVTHTEEPADAAREPSTDGLPAQPGAQYSSSTSIELPCAADVQAASTAQGRGSGSGTWAEPDTAALAACDSFVKRSDIHEDNEWPEEGDQTTESAVPPAEQARWHDATSQGVSGLRSASPDSPDITSALEQHKYSLPGAEHSAVSVGQEDSFADATQEDDMHEGPAPTQHPTTNQPTVSDAAAHSALSGPGEASGPEDEGESALVSAVEAAEDSCLSTAAGGADLADTASSAGAQQPASPTVASPAAVTELAEATAPAQAGHVSSDDEQAPESVAQPEAPASTAEPEAADTASASGVTASPDVDMEDSSVAACLQQPEPETLHDTETVAAAATAECEATQPASSPAKAAAEPTAPATDASSPTRAAVAEAECDAMDCDEAEPARAEDSQPALSCELASSDASFAGLGDEAEPVEPVRELAAPALQVAGLRRSLGQLSPAAAVASPGAGRAPVLLSMPVAASSPAAMAAPAKAAEAAVPAAAFPAAGSPAAATAKPSQPASPAATASAAGGAEAEEVATEAAVTSGGSAVCDDPHAADTFDLGDTSDMMDTDEPTTAQQLASYAAPPSPLAQPATSQASSPAQAPSPTAAVSPPRSQSPELPAAGAKQGQLPVLQPTPSMSLLAADLMAALQTGEDGSLTLSPVKSAHSPPQPAAAAGSSPGSSGGGSFSAAKQRDAAAWAGLEAAAFGSPEPATALAPRSPGDVRRSTAEIHATALGLMDMDVDTPLRSKGDVSGGVDDLLPPMPALESTPSPIQSCQNSPRSHIQVTRESIPLFVRDSYAVTDSVSLERQSLASIEPYARPGSLTAGVPSHGVRSSTARPSHMMASMLTLDTLREEETLAEDLAAKPLTPARAPATHAGRGLGRGALSDGTLDALPSDLPDPVAHLVAASEMQGPGAAGTGEGTAVRSPTSLPLAAAASTGTATKAAPADAAAISLKGQVARTPNTASRRIVGPAAGAQHAKTPHHHPVPPPSTRSGSAGGSKGGAAATPAMATKTAHGATARHPAPAVTPQAAARPAAADHGAARGSKVQKPTAGHAASGAHSKAVPAPVPAIAGPPPIPASWATPMTKMQALPMQYALNAPLMDNSPFPLDDNLDTTNIMEEAARMAQELGGATQARGMMHPAASPMTPTVLDLSQGAPLSSNGAEVTTPDLTLGALSPYKPSDKTTSLPPTSVFRTTTLPHGLGAASGAIGLSPSAAGFLEAQNATLLEKLMAAEQRAKSAEQQVEQVKDQIQTMQFGDMLQEPGANDMEREARLYAEEQLAAAHHQVATLQKTVLALQSDIQIKEASLKESQANVRKLLSDVQTKDQDLDTTRAQLNTAAKEVADLKHELQVLRAESQQMQTKLQADVNMLQQQLNAAGKDVTRLRAQRDELNAVVKRGSEELITEQLKNKQYAADAEKKMTALNASMVRYKKERDDLRGERETMVRQLNDVKQSAAAMKAVHDAEFSKLKRERDDLIRIAEELMGRMEQNTQK